MNFENIEGGGRGEEERREKREERREKRETEDRGQRTEDRGRGRGRGRDRSEQSERRWVTRTYKVLWFVKVVCSRINVISFVAINNNALHRPVLANGHVDVVESFRVVHDLPSVGSFAVDWFGGR